MFGQILKGKHGGDGLFRIHGMDGLDHSRRDQPGIAGGTHAEIRVLLRELFDRDIEHRAGAAFERLMRHVGHHADDGDPLAGALGQIELQALADGRGLARPPAPRGVFADHRNVRVVAPVARAQEPPLAKRNVHGGEIVRTHHLKQGSGLVAGLWNAILDGEAAPIIVAAVGHGLHYESGADAGEGAGALHNLPVKCRLLAALGVAIFSD